MLRLAGRGAIRALTSASTGIPPAPHISTTSASSTSSPSVTKDDSDHKDDHREGEAGEEEEDPSHQSGFQRFATVALVSGLTFHSLFSYISLDEQALHDATIRDLEDAKGQANLALHPPPPPAPQPPLSQRLRTGVNPPGVQYKIPQPPKVILLYLIFLIKF
jgi:hypothetical protein